ncbi:MAG: hypothetical protein AB7F89_07040 [Pirellulaceae bacterium]
MSLRIACVFLACVSTTAFADDPVPEVELSKQLVGTWKMVSAKFGGKESDLPTRLTVLKHVTPTHMTWMRSDPKTGEVVAMASGVWTISGDKYSDTPTMGMGPQFATVKGGTHTFTCRIVGDKWFHTGKLATGLTIEEVWERQKAATEPK